MIDGFVILTPILLLAVIALLGFVGCDRVLGLNYINPPMSPVTPVQGTIKRSPAGTGTITADPLTLQGGELIIATVQWSSGSVQQPTPTLTGAAFTAIPGGGPFDWNGMKIQSFVATNPANNTSLTVTATLTGGSNVVWHLCVSAYDKVDDNLPVYSPQQSGPAFIGTNPQAPPINVGSGDIVYAVAFAADNNGTFPSTNSLTPGPGFQTEFDAISNPLIEDGGTGNPVTAQATVSSLSPNPRAFIFAMGIKATPSS